ncbi:MAG: DedA family protein [Nanoarchaeota archaeon]
MALTYNPISFILNIDIYLSEIIKTYGSLTYVILFMILFLETGLVITPFLPGDSLVFVAGAFAAHGAINIIFLFIILSAGAILGDTVNYWIGSYFGEKFFLKSRFFKKEYFDRTNEFYRKHGGKTIILARFMPVIRTFAPFVAGIGKMNYRRFLLFNISGGILWISLFLFAGYYFGTIPFVKENLTIFILIIIFLSIIPLIVEYLRKK